MKRAKFLLPLIAIIFIAAGVFAMKAKQSSAKNAPQVTYRWFQISGSHDPNASVPSSDALYLQTSDTPPDDDACDGSTHQCISGFDASQTTPSGSGYVLNGSQAPNASAPNVLKD